MPKIKNIIIFTAIAVILILIYVFFIKPVPNQADLISSAPLPNVGAAGASGTNPNTPNGNSLNTQDFLTLLLNVQNIKLNDSIFSDPAFAGLHDSSIVLTPDGTQGRPNPFAQFGNDSVPASLPVSISSTTPSGNAAPTKP